MASMKMKDICLKIGSGATPRGGKESYTDSGISLIRSQNVLDFSFSYDGLAHINQLQADKLNNVTVATGDVLLNITGDSVARACIVDNDVFPARVNQHVAIIRANEKLVVSSYILYFLQMSKPYLLQLAAGGATRNALTKSMIEELEIEIPPIEQQQKIVSLIDNIQRKIRENNAINENLYAQMRTLTKQWITENSSDYELLPLAKIASINPDTYSLKEEWEYVNYLDTSSITDGYIAEIQHITLSTEKLPSRARRKIAPNDVVFSTVRPNQRHFGILSEPMPNMLGSTGFAVIRSNNPLVCNELIYLCLTENEFIEKMQQLAEQSTSTFPSIKPSDLGVCEIPCPKDDASKSFFEMLKSMFALIAENQRENISLATTRDTLLPKLMSGELDVSSIQI